MQTNENTRTDQKPTVIYLVIDAEITIVRNYKKTGLDKLDNLARLYSYVGVTRYYLLPNAVQNDARSFPRKNLRSAACGRYQYDDSKSRRASSWRAERRLSS